jgi:hypothetical protein
VVLRDGSILGGGSFFYFIGTYSCSGGRWKGEATQQEHTPAPHTFATAGRNVSAGFTGTYTDDGAEFEATALVGKRSKPSISCSHAATESGLTEARHPTCLKNAAWSRSD